MSDQDQQEASTVLVLTPAADEPAAAGVEDPHVTLAYLDDGSNGAPDGAMLDDLRDVVETIANHTQPFQMKVSGTGFLGPDRARVLLLESEELKTLREQLLSAAAVIASMTAEQYPFFIPHMTLGYDGTELPDPAPEQLSGAALGLWVQGTKESFALGGDPSTGYGDENADVITPVRTAEDLEVGIRTASVYPAGRWYVAKRARALGLEHRLPRDWGAA